MMMRDQTQRTPNPLFAWLLIGALTATVLAGCIEAPDDDPAGDGDGPRAVLHVDRHERWTGEVFVLDGRNSSTADAPRIQWRFDLGDGTTHQGDNLSQAVVRHEYAHGGAYLAVFTLNTKNPEGENVSTSTHETLVVNERFEIEQQVLIAAPLGETPPELNETPANRGGQNFRAYPNATHWETDVQLSSHMPAGDSEVTVRVRDRDNHTLAEQNTTIPAGENRTLRLNGPVPETDTYGVEIIVHSGGVQSHGTIRVYYAGDDPDAS